MPGKKQHEVSGHLPGFHVSRALVWVYHGTMSRSRPPIGADLFSDATPDHAKQRLAEFAADHGLAASSDALPSRYAHRDGSQRQVSPKSLEAYQRRGLYLLNEYLRLGGNGNDGPADAWPEALPDPSEWVAWMVRERRPGLSAPTWRLYRRSVAEILTRWPVDHPDIDRLRLQVDTAEPLTGKGRERSRSDRRTSAKRAREIRPEDLFSLLLYLDEAGSGVFGADASRQARQRGVSFLPGDTFARVLADWLVAGLATGLRPAEWRQSLLSYIPRGVSGDTPGAREIGFAEGFWTDVERVTPARVLATWNTAAQLLTRGHLDRPLPGKLWLVTYNAKHSNGRGNDDTRSLDISRSPPRIHMAALRMVLRGVWHHDEGDWETLQKSANTRLNTIQREIFPNRESRINLYSCRHQAFANFKARTTLFDVAVLAGHGDPESPDHFYSRAFRAWKENWSDILERARNGDEGAIAELGDLIVFLKDKRRKGGGKGGGGFRPDPRTIDACLHNMATVTSLQGAPPPQPLPAEAKMLAARHGARLAARAQESGMVVDTHAPPLAPKPPPLPRIQGLEPS